MRVKTGEVIPLIPKKHEGKAKRTRASIPISQRFWPKVEKKGPDDCWLWTAAKLVNGYGVINNKGKLIRAHRYAYEEAYGPIPEGKCVLHTCDCPGCVNPRHLKIGTAKDNVRDMMLRGRNARKLTNEQVLEIVRLRTEQQTYYKTLAVMFDVTEGAIYQIMAGKSYGWLTGIKKKESKSRKAA